MFLRDQAEDSTTETTTYFHVTSSRCESVGLSSTQHGRCRCLAAMAALEEHHVPANLENDFLLLAAIRIPYQIGGSRGATTSALLRCGG